MKYVTLTPEVFFDENGWPSPEYLSQYCQLPTTNKFIYDGGLDGTNHKNLIFPNIVKGNSFVSYNIVMQFPDLVEAKIFYYCLIGAVDLGNLKSVNTFHMYFRDTNKTLLFIRRYIKIIDENTLIINRKELNVADNWVIGLVSNNNYKNFQL